MVLLCISSNAQNLTGVWKGTINEHAVERKLITNQFEMQIIQTDLSIKALVTYSLFATGCDYGSELTKKSIASSECNSFDISDQEFNSLEKKFRIGYNDISGAIKIADCKQISCTILDREKVCLPVHYVLYYNTPYHNKKESISGIIFKGKMDDFDTTSNGCNDGYENIMSIRLTRESETLTPSQSFFINKNSLSQVSSASAPFFLNFEKSGIASLRPIFISDSKAVPIDIKTRKNETLKTIKVNSKQVEISIYDYGQIDHDIVSVYVDKEPVLVKEELTKKPLLINLEMDDYNNFHEVILVAENLGDIPPNTSLMKIKAGDKKYEIKITSDEQKNAVVYFKYKG
ncbi:hypothetical protein [Flavobacterium anhuiense]|nr:hypothetical protein [Flavobacterium anhuiense]